VGIITNQAHFENERLVHFTNEISRIKREGYWTKEGLVNLFRKLIPEFEHEEKGKYLDAKM
jgi:hypothetical protein